MEWSKLEDHFSQIYQDLIGEPIGHFSNDRYIQRLQKSFEEHLTWFQEIPGEVMKNFSVKR